MKAFAWAVLGVCLTASPTWASHVSVPIIIVRPTANAVGIPETPGRQASLKLDVMTPLSETMQGDLHQGSIIAAYQVRAAEAIVLDAPIKATQRLLPAGTALAKVDAADLDGTPATLWCDSRRRFSAFYSVDCLQDDGSGALRRLWTGHLFAWKDALGVVTATVDATRLAADMQTPHHLANPDERPTGRVGYAYCDGDGVSGPPRFTTAITVSADGGWIKGMPYTCTLGEWSNADHSSVMVDKIRLAISPGPTLTYKVVSGLAAMQIVSASAGRPFKITSPADGNVQLVSASPPDPHVVKKISVLEVAGPPSFIASGEVEPNGELLRLPVRHGITGVLTNGVSFSGLFGGHTIAAGQAVYGVPMSNAAAGHPAIVWCALQKQGAGLYSTCFPHDGVAYRWVDVSGPFAVSFIWSSSSLKASAPSVKITFDDLHLPLKLSYTFVAWKKDGSAIVRITVATDAGSHSDRMLKLFPQPEGAIILASPIGRISLRHGQNDADAIVQVATATSSAPTTETSSAVQ